MKDIMNCSCIYFIPYSVYQQYHEPSPHHPDNYIFLTTGPACSSEVGMRDAGGPQSLLLNEKLCPRGKVIHELLHALGFLHMHTAK
jgi:hypothetical protein